VWARLLAAFVFCICFAVTFWYALVHTVHQGTVAVPALKAQSIEGAEQIAHDMGLAVLIEEPGVFSGDVPAGSIARQQPYAGFHVRTGSTVTVRLSLGSERVEIPDIRGDSVQSALRALERSGLVPGRQVEVKGQAGGDLVMATDPPVGSELAPGGSVDLLVNVTPLQEIWVMPVLLARSEDTVRRFCRESHLRLGQVHEIPYPGLAPGRVVRQYPLEGSRLARSDIITIWVSR